MNGRARTAVRFSGPQHATDAATIEAWVRGASKGEELVYCSAPDLIRGEGSAKVTELVGQGVVRSHQYRRAGGGWDFVIHRTGYVLKGVRGAVQQPNAAPLDQAAQTILSAMKRAANFELPCPTDAQLAQLAGLDTRDQAQWRVRKLVQRGLIASEQVTEDGATTRIVTIVGPGGVAKSSLAPPKHRAALKALRATAERGE